VGGAKAVVWAQTSVAGVGTGVGTKIETKIETGVGACVGTVAVQLRP
jgi:hypothetical protein